VTYLIGIKNISQSPLSSIFVGPYAIFYNVNLEEVQNLNTAILSLHNLFTRRVFPRPIDPNSNSLCSPADSVLYSMTTCTGDKDKLTVKGK
jgi:phosphatidylserine decarboxylase